MSRWWVGGANFNSPLKTQRPTTQEPTYPHSNQPNTQYLPHLHGSSNHERAASNVAVRQRDDLWVAVVVVVVRVLRVPNSALIVPG